MSRKRLKFKKRISSVSHEQFLGEDRSEYHNSGDGDPALDPNDVGDGGIDSSNQWGTTRRNGNRSWGLKKAGEVKVSKKGRTYLPPTSRRNQTEERAAWGDFPMQNVGYTKKSRKHKYRPASQQPFGLLTKFSGVL
ncbi:hypothetical protein L1987_14242 [Smallanthus sonchifolius]|uniref:Uncharacterized protein n=1 Tax=Smallanthus sonchifolius TaxID=185202 RepID=A0ACB9J5R5_9ASTR|nr:hypothetical protein L1987_14242 [Smallanthus sonchifolius]